MYYNNQWRSSFFIIVGIILLFLAGNDLLMRFIVALFGLVLINQGLRMRGLPSLQFILQSFLDTLRF